MNDRFNHEPCGAGALARENGTLPPVPQPGSYHQFADQRPWLGIANFGNVVSNLAFAIVGLWGLWFLSKPDKLKNTFIDLRERRPYVVAFLGLLLTAFGSAY